MWKVLTPRIQSQYLGTVHRMAYTTHSMNWELPTMWKTIDSRERFDFRGWQLKVAPELIWSRNLFYCLWFASFCSTNRFLFSTGKGSERNFLSFRRSFQFQCYLRTPNQTFSLFKTYSQVLIPRIIGTIVACDNNTTTRTFMTSTALRCSGQHTVIHWIDKDNPVRRGHSCNSRHTTAPLLVVVVVVVARVVVDPFLSLHTLCERSQTS